MSKANDFYELLTAKLVASLKDATGNWMKPWTSQGGSPRNVLTGKAYQGSNRLMFAFSGFSSQYWGTYKQWAEKGAQVQKGQKGTPGLFWTIRPVRQADGTEKDVPFARSFTVFNAEQVDGWTPPVVASPNGDERIAEVEAFFTAVGATVNTGSQAFYRPGTDEITMPAFEAFKDAPSYYGTLAHEYGHWTGSPTRLDRDLKNRFGSEGYALEELVAELTALFVLGDFGVAVEPREDHVQYIKHWLTVAAADEKAVYTAAQAAQKAVNFLHETAKVPA